MFANVYASAIESAPVIMVKRTCPFNDDLNPQLKIHVSDKEVATGVMRDHHMKAVYDRTKDLLFRGAKKSVTSIVEVSHSNATLKGTCHTALNCGPSLKQMQLTPEGQLSCSKESHVFSVSENLATCSKCFDSNGTEMNACSFCDLMLCPMCLQTCGKCNEHFCSACSFNVYDASDGYICRNCC